MSNHKHNKKEMKKENKENIIVPVEWLSELAKQARIAKKDGDHMSSSKNDSLIMHLIDYALTAEILLKHGIRK